MVPLVAIEAIGVGVLAAFPFSFACGVLMWRSRSRFLPWSLSSSVRSTRRADGRRGPMDRPNAPERARVTACLDRPGSARRSCEHGIASAIHAGDVARRLRHPRFSPRRQRRHLAGRADDPLPSRVILIEEKAQGGTCSRSARASSRPFSAATRARVKAPGSRCTSEAEVHREQIGEAAEIDLVIADRPAVTNPLSDGRSPTATASAARRRSHPPIARGRRREQRGGRGPACNVGLPENIAVVSDELTRLAVPQA